MLYIRQGATHKVVIGPAVAVGDGFTPVTTLALNTADEAEVILHDNGTVVDISGYTFAAITTADGYYHLTLQSGISNTVGHMTVVINDDSLILPLRADFTVLEEAIYDALFAGSATGALPVSSGGIVAASFGAGAIDAAAIADNAIDAGAIAADAITSAKIADNAIAAAKIATGAITAAKFAAGAIDAAAIATDAIDADALAADAIAEINATVDAALADYDAPTRAELTSDINSVIAYLDGFVIAKGTIGATGNTTTTLHLAGLTYGDDEINNYLIAIKDVSTGEWHARYIEDWADTGDLVTVATLPFTPEASVDLYAILAFRQDVTGGAGLDAAGVRAAVGLASANLDTQLGDIPTVAEFEARTIVSANYATNAELAKVPKSDSNVTWNATALASIQSEANDALVAYDPPTRAELTTDTNSVLTRLGTPAGADVSADIAAVKAETATIVADTNELQVDWTNGGRLDLIVDAILADTVVIGTPAGASLSVDVAAVKTDTAAVLVDTTQIKADLPSRPTKNTQLANFPFVMVDETDGFTAETGLTVTATRSLDGAAFGACANAVSEVGNGVYKITLAAADLNADTVVLKFTATGARTRLINIVTQP